ncbi:hypothetical protein CDAR_466401 [Caerostris darwini]|uniref:Uncharacterized protein n=1 Tax=Caerostris darwini TaxID=1538125 RepID=A0AAV4WQX0_9ARAC|nr:hypothetical protein CDAR_466401 [Caerostris darwini]
MSHRIVRETWGDYCQDRLHVSRIMNSHWGDSSDFSWKNTHGKTKSSFQNRLQNWTLDPPFRVKEKESEQFSEAAQVVESCLSKRTC